MKREQLEHVLRAAGAITNENIILVLGSQSVLGAHPEPPLELARSMEADIFPMEAPEKMELINGSIGEISQFQETFGYYAHGIPPESCPLPTGWEKRLHSIESENTRGVVGLCLDPTDLAASKLVAGREKDLEFVEELIHHRLITIENLSERIHLIKLSGHAELAEGNYTIVTSRMKKREIGN